MHDIIFLGGVMFRYYLALYVGRFLNFLLSFFYKKGTQFPGRVALFLCPNFLLYVKKPAMIIGITGTKGKTTVSNLLVDVFLKNNISIIHNCNRSNIDGIACCLLKAKGNEEYAILEVDERSLPSICSYLPFDYLLVTNLFQDAMDKDTHSEDIKNIIDQSILPQTVLILNADDLISAQLGKENKKVYFGIDPIEEILQNKTNLSRDIMSCPECSHPLIYDYIYYHHIGRVHCKNCSFSSVVPNYHVTEIDFQEKKITVRNFNKINIYPIIGEGIFHLYNELAVITLLSELKFNKAILSKMLREIHIT